MKSITFFAQKGGVGKTTLCLNIAAMLAAERRRVLVIDLDRNRSASNYVDAVVNFEASVAAALLGVFLLSFYLDGSPARYAFDDNYVLDSLSLFFKRFFLLTAIFVLVMATEFAVCIRTGIVEYYSLIFFALAGMMFAAPVFGQAAVPVRLKILIAIALSLALAGRAGRPPLPAGEVQLLMALVLEFGIGAAVGYAASLVFAGVGGKERNAFVFENDG